MKNIIKNNKKIFLGIIIGLIFSVSLVSAAVINYSSDEVSFNNSTSHLKNSNNEITLKDALDALYDEVNAYGCTNGRSKVVTEGGSYGCAHKTYAITSGYTCVRASWLHKEKCLLTSGACYADGYYTGGSMNTDMVTYGNLGTSGGNLEVGDAFDCDVNGNGYIDVDGKGYSTERFYYVSPRWTPGTDVSSAAFDANTAVLIYFSNTYNGLISNNAVRYALNSDIQNAYPNETITVNDNWHGPVTAIMHLPKTTSYGGTWGDFIVKDNNNNSTRAIIACNNYNCSTPSTATSGGSTPQSFNYEGNAGRLLTLPELKYAGCDTLSGKTGLGTVGSLKSCNFLFERTRYTDSSLSYGPWLENVYTSSSSDVYHTDGVNRRVNYSNAGSQNYGARPVIEVPVSQILK